MFLEDNFQKFIERIVKVLYPENLNCVICNMPISRKNKYSICHTCREKMIFIHEACGKCGKPKLNLSIDENNYYKDCGYCKGKSFIFDRNISFIEYNQISKKMVFSLKYSGKTYLAKIIAQIIYDSMLKYNSEELDKADLIMYVPLSKERKRDRGFNQSEKIALYLSFLTGIKISSAVYRSKNTKKLHKMMASNRKKELLGAFSIKEGEESLEGKNILIVDDIFTTGATINEISKELKLRGVNRIVALTFLTGRYNS
ncbi:ComF family protein [Peptostreptococcus russellii]|uniref:ComF family protein n=1 Tax=Peptostreptococcus russellii TaxID=215200 RepID=UPI001FAD0F6B|nr:ComF family protein [Peptostreptococcus russellii]